MDQSNINCILQTVEKQSQRTDALEAKVQMLENFLKSLGARHDNALTRLAVEVREIESRYQNSIQGIRNDIINLETRERVI